MTVECGMGFVFRVCLPVFLFCYRYYSYYMFKKNGKVTVASLVVYHISKLLTKLNSATVPAIMTGFVDYLRYIIERNIGT